MSSKVRFPCPRQAEGEVGEEGEAEASLGERLRGVSCRSVCVGVTARLVVGVERGVSCTTEMDSASVVSSGTSKWRVGSGGCPSTSCCRRVTICWRQGMRIRIKATTCSFIDTPAARRGKLRSADPEESVSVFEVEGEDRALGEVDNKGRTTPVSGQRPVDSGLDDFLTTVGTKGRVDNIGLTKCTVANATTK